MSANLDKNFKNELLNCIKPDINTLIWISDQALGSEISGFKEINYLFDGLISKSILNENDQMKKDNLMTVMQTQLFDGPFLLIHSIANEKNLSTLKIKIEQLFKNSNDQKNCIAYIPKDIKKAFEKNFSNAFKTFQIIEH